MKRQIAFLAACLVSLACAANDVRYYAEDQVPSADDIAALLAAPVGLGTPADMLEAVTSVSHGGRTRGVRLLDGQVGSQRILELAPARKPTRHHTVPADAMKPVAFAKIASVGSVALALRFGTDDAQILPQQRAQLDALAAGIKRLPAQAVITIAGHTDAFGSSLYNIDLSLKRAMAVRSYLIHAHGIAGKRLVAMGKGESEPLNRTNPFAAENRRVQVSAEYDAA